jgi:hypothetical protein
LDKSLVGPFGSCNEDVELELELEEDGGVDEIPLLSTWSCCLFIPFLVNSVL